MAVGHIYYFLEDIFPNQPGGFKLLRTPRILRIICDRESEEDRAYQPMPEAERPGGYAWGQPEDAPVGGGDANVGNNQPQ